ncbi:kdel motif-containing protein 1, partial [Plakobranchus ocellatus]
MCIFHAAIPNCDEVSLKQSRIWGPGLKSDFRVPVRYFYIQLVNKDGANVTYSVGKKAITAVVSPVSGEHARIWTEVLDRHDGSYIVRFRPFSSTSDLRVEITMQGRHMAESPYIIEGPVYDEGCDCPDQTPDQWAASIGCPATYKQIRLDLEPFKDIHMTKVAKEAVERFNQRGHHSICHYKIVKNKIYRKCYGEHVGFKMFSDAILLSLSRKMVLPDTEFFMNLGDWPLEDRPFSSTGPAPLPIFSWCGSKKTRDIVLPTYDLTEATLEMMGR